MLPPKLAAILPPLPAPAAAACQRLARLGRRPLPVGVDVDAAGVRLMQVEAEPGGVPRVIAAARCDLPSSPPSSPSSPSSPTGAGGAWLSTAAGDATVDLLRRGGFGGRRVVVAVPASMTQYRTLRVAADAGPELAKTLAAEARGALGVDLTAGRHVVHFLPGDPLRRGGGGQREGLMAVVAKADLDSLVAAFDERGLEVAGVDLSPLALFRGVQRFGRRRRDEGDVHVLVRPGARSTQVTVGRGQRVSFLKNVSLGVEAIHRAVARKLDLTPADAERLCRRLAAQRREAADAAGSEATAADIGRDPVARAVAGAARPVAEDLARELALCLRYFCVTFQCRRPERITICGPAASDPWLIESLSRGLPVPVEARRPLEELQVDDALRAGLAEHDEEFDTALGLALRFAPSGLAGRWGPSRQAQAAADRRAALNAQAAGVADDLPPPSVAGDDEPAPRLAA